MRQPPNAAARSLAIPPGTAAVTCKVPEPFPRSSGPREASCRICGRRPAALYSPLRESTLSAIPPPSDKPLSNYPKTLSSPGFYGGYTPFSDSY
jgi:hypothetical protein